MNLNYNNRIIQQVVFKLIDSFGADILSMTGNPHTLTVYLELKLDSKIVPPKELIFDNAKVDITYKKVKQSYIDLTDPNYLLQGPTTGLAQTWTPNWLVEYLWQGMAICGFNPKPNETLYDLAAGNGRLLEFKSYSCKLLLNDIEPKLTGILKKKFPNQSVMCADFMDLVLPRTKYIIGSPPWMTLQGKDMPTEYFKVCERLIANDGLIGLIVPSDFNPTTRLKVKWKHVPNQTELQKKNWQYSVMPKIIIFSN